MAHPLESTGPDEPVADAGAAAMARSASRARPPVVVLDLDRPRRHRHRTRCSIGGPEICVGGTSANCEFQPVDLFLGQESAGWHAVDDDRVDDITTGRVVDVGRRIGFEIIANAGQKVGEPCRLFDRDSAVDCGAVQAFSLSRDIGRLAQRRNMARCGLLRCRRGYLVGFAFPAHALALIGSVILSAFRPLRHVRRHHKARALRPESRHFSPMKQPLPQVFSVQFADGSWLAVAPMRRPHDHGWTGRVEGRHRPASGAAARRT